MGQGSSDKDFRAVYQYRDLLLLSWPKIEKKASFIIRENGNDFKYIKEMFFLFLEFNAKNLKKDSVVWSDTSWLFKTLVKEKTFIFEEIDMKQYYKLINLFRHNESIILERLYAGDMGKVDEILQEIE